METRIQRFFVATAHPSHELLCGSGTYGIGGIPLNMGSMLQWSIAGAGALALLFTSAATQAPHADPVRPGDIPASAMPAILGPVMFNTAVADAICGALQVFPPDNPWNLVVEDWPLHPNSAKIISSIGINKPLRYNQDMAFMLVPPDQRRINLVSVHYAGESDKGPFPIPDNLPIEGWPVAYRGRDGAKTQTLDDVQRDRLNKGGDRHGIVVDPVNRMLYEFFAMKKTDAGWSVGQASVFDLRTNKLRPAGWTSADAAGLPIFPAVVRYDELKRGIVGHAMRVTVRRTRRAYVAPVTHYASRLTDPDLPRMGERIPVLHEELRRINGSAFEVVVPPR